MRLPDRRLTPAASVSLPPALRTLAPPHRRAAERWWAALTPRERKELRRFYGGDGLSDRRAWVAFRALRLELGGIAADPASVDDAALHHEALYEYWGANPELTFSLEERQFHICHAHAGAREVWRRGVIPSAFRCPRRDDACPFVQAAACANGRDVLLLPRLAGSAHVVDEPDVEAGRE
ncbi:MAG: hypothetical protein KC586_30705 [Myxococcales bacterium]|nr:hypothetical protein [Myxococcales bacterium]